MRASPRLFMLLVLGASLLAYAAVTVKVGGRQWFLEGIYVGTRSSNVGNTAANLITRSVGALCDQDPPNILANDTYDFTHCTVTGSQLGDPCFVAQPMDASIMLNCGVVATDLVKVRAHNMAGDAAVNLGDAGYYVRVLSPQ